MARFNDKNTKKGPIPQKKLSERGERLEKAHRASENSNILRGQTAFMCASGGKEVPVKVGQRCPECKKRVRGIHHENGTHHRGIAIKCGR